MSGPLVSIIMRSYNEAWALRDTLAAIKTQNYPRWELIVIDSGSTDGSDEIFKKFAPQHYVRITPQEYVPGRVMNMGMRLARSEHCVFLNADATPQGSNWLRPLADALEDPANAAVFGRQVPRPDCHAVFACDYERCFGEARESAKWGHFFSMVSSGLRKDVWAKRGFLEDVQYAEDDEYTRWCVANNYRVVYVPESVVMHSHNYTPQQAYKRSFGDAKTLGACWKGSPSEFNWFKTVALGVLSDLRHDVRYCARIGKPAEIPRAAVIRWQQRRGKLDGFRAGWENHQTAGK